MVAGVVALDSVGTAWICAGLDPGRDVEVEVVSVEIEPDLAASAGSWSWPPYVHVLTGDALALAGTLGRFDLVFADAVSSKYEDLESTIGLLRVGGSLLVDDLRTKAGRTDANAKKDALRRRLLGHERLQAVELDWSSGAILAVALREPDTPPTPDAPDTPPALSASRATPVRSSWTHDGGISAWGRHDSQPECIAQQVNTLLVDVISTIDIRNMLCSRVIDRNKRFTCP